MPHEISASPRYCGERGNIGRAGAGYLLQAFEVLDDRKAEADQRDRRAQPRHHRAFKGKTGADPGEMSLAVALTSNLLAPVALPGSAMPSASLLTSWGLRRVPGFP